MTRIAAFGGVYSNPYALARAGGRLAGARLRRAVLPRRPRRLRRRVRRRPAAAARARRHDDRRQLRRRDRPRRRGLRLRLRRRARQPLRAAHVRLHAGAHVAGVRGVDGRAAGRAARRRSAASTSTWSTARRWRSTTSCGSRWTTTSWRCACARAARGLLLCTHTGHPVAARGARARGSSTSARSAGRRTTAARTSGTRSSTSTAARSSASSSSRWPTTGARRRRRCARPGCPSRSSRRSRPAGGRRAWRSSRRASARAAPTTSTARRCRPASPSTAPAGPSAPAPADDDRPVVSLFGTALFPPRLWVYSNFHCNLACDYCVVASSPSARKRELSGGALRARSSTRRCARASTELYLTGGEPFVHPEIVELVEYASDRMTTVVLTNAMLFTGRRRARARAPRGPPEPHAAVLDRRRQRRDARPLARRGLVGEGDGRPALRGGARPAAARRDDVDARQRATRSRTLREMLATLGIAGDDFAVRPLVQRGFAAEASAAGAIAGLRRGHGPRAHDHGRRRALAPGRRRPRVLAGLPRRARRRLARRGQAARSSSASSCCARPTARCRRRSHARCDG